MKEVAIVSAVRTPIGAYCGMLKDLPVEKLAAIVLNEAVKKANVKPENVDDVILGQSFANGESPNVARLALLEAGWPIHVPGLTLDRRCCSGLQSIWSAAMEIQTENAEIVVNGGMPQHDHGFPTSPQVTEELGDGEYLVEGVKFNMAGWWEMTLAITANGQSDSITFNIVLQ